MSGATTLRFRLTSSTRRKFNFNVNRHVNQFVRGSSFQLGTRRFNSFGRLLIASKGVTRRLITFGTRIGFDRRFVHFNVRNFPIGFTGTVGGLAARRGIFNGNWLQSRIRFLISGPGPNFLKEFQPNGYHFFPRPWGHANVTDVSADGRFRRNKFAHTIFTRRHRRTTQVSVWHYTQRNFCTQRNFVSTFGLGWYFRSNLEASHRRER